MEVHRGPARPGQEPEPPAGGPGGVPPDAPPAGQWIELFELGTPKSAASSATQARKALGPGVEVAVRGCQVIARAVPEEAE